MEERWAVIGTRKGAKADLPEAQVCLAEEFNSRDEALAFAHSNPECAIYDDVLPVPYRGERFVERGGRCFYFARRVLADEYRYLAELAFPDEPKVVIGERDFLQDGKMVRGPHAWIEAGDRVIDCGCFVKSPEEGSRNEYRSKVNATELSVETIGDVERMGFRRTAE